MRYALLLIALPVCFGMVCWCPLRARRCWTTYRLVRRQPVLLATDTDLAHASHVSWNDERGAWPEPGRAPLSVRQLRGFAAVAEERERRNQLRYRTLRSALSLIWVLPFGGWIGRVLIQQYQAWKAVGFSSPSENLSPWTLVIATVIALIVVLDSLGDPGDVERRRTVAYRQAAVAEEQRTRRRMGPIGHRARRASMPNLRR